jgi:ABC-type Na+ efflux pump permease subunit
MGGRAAAAALGAVALFGAWQMARRRFLPGRMPERWCEEEARLKWLRVVHGTVLIAGSVVFFGYGIGYFLAPGHFSRTTSWLVVVGYFVVISMMSDFLKDREPGAETGRPGE